MDMEFTGLHQNTTPISIAIETSCGKQFYAEFTDYDRSQVDDWLQKNVIDNLIFTKREDQDWENRDDNRCLCCEEYGRVARALRLWLQQFEQVEIWGDCLAYDWVLFCELFGGALKLPENIYYIPFDLCTLLKEKGFDPDVNREEFAGEHSSNTSKHNALHDAQIIKKCYYKIKSLQNGIVQSGFTSLLPSEFDLRKWFAINPDWSNIDKVHELGKLRGAETVIAYVKQRLEGKPQMPRPGEYFENDEEANKQSTRAHLLTWRQEYERDLQLWIDLYGNK